MMSKVNMTLSEDTWVPGGKKPYHISKYLSLIEGFIILFILETVNQES